MSKKSKMKQGKKGQGLTQSLRTQLDGMHVDPKCLATGEIIQISRHPDRFRHGWMTPEAEIESARRELRAAKATDLEERELQRSYDLRAREARQSYEASYLAYVEKVLCLA